MNYVVERGCWLWSNLHGVTASKQSRWCWGTQSYSAFMQYLQLVQICKLVQMCSAYIYAQCMYIVQCKASKCVCTATFSKQSQWCWCTQQHWLQCSTTQCNSLGLFAVHFTQYTVYSEQCGVYSVHSGVYSVHCTVHNVQCTVYSVQCTVWTGWRDGSCHHSTKWFPCPAINNHCQWWFLLIYNAAISDS